MLEGRAFILETQIGTEFCVHVCCRNALQLHTWFLILSFSSQWCTLAKATLYMKLKQTNSAFRHTNSTVFLPRHK